MFELDKALGVRAVDRIIAKGDDFLEYFFSIPELPLSIKPKQTHFSPKDEFTGLFVGDSLKKYIANTQPFDVPSPLQVIIAPIKKMKGLPAGSHVYYEPLDFSQSFQKASKLAMLPEILLKAKLLTSPQENDKYGLASTDHPTVIGLFAGENERVCAVYVEYTKNYGWQYLLSNNEIEWGSRQWDICL